MANTKDPIIASCEAEWDEWKIDCSGFVKAVAKRLGLKLVGQANQIIDAIEVTPIWTKLGAESERAIGCANQGCFVIGGLKNRPNGHVVVVVRSSPQKYPVAYWGRLGAVGCKNRTINWSWSHADLPKVQFYSANQ